MLLSLHFCSDFSGKVESGTEDSNECLELRQSVPSGILMYHSKIITAIDLRESSEIW